MTDFTKPGFYKTRDGRKAEVIAYRPEDMADEESLIGILDRDIKFWYMDGVYSRFSTKGALDLIAPWEETKDPQVGEWWETSRDYCVEVIGVSGDADFPYRVKFSSGAHQYLSREAMQKHIPDYQPPKVYDLSKMWVVWVLQPDGSLLKAAQFFENKDAAQKHARNFSGVIAITPATATSFKHGEGLE